jgi:hypothetical protein
VEPRFVDTVRGVLFGWSNEFQADAVITLNSKLGLRVWYQHNLGRCKICPDKKRCRSTLLGNATQYGVSLTNAERELEPSRLSGIIFSKLRGPDIRKAPTVPWRTGH